MTETTASSDVETRKKKGWIAALLNLFLPGAGYFYCGRFWLGITAFVIIFFVMISGVRHDNLSGIMIAVIAVVIDGFLCARRYNNKILREAEKIRETEKRERDNMLKIERDMLKIERGGETRKFSYDNFSIFEAFGASIGFMFLCIPFYLGLFAGVEFPADKNPIVNTAVPMLNSTFFQIIFVLLSAGLFIYSIIASIKSIGMEEAFIELSNDTISIPKVDVVARSISITTLKYTEILSLKEIITESKNTVTGSKMGSSTELKLATKVTRNK